MVLAYSEVEMTTPPSSTVNVGSTGVPVYVYVPLTRISGVTVLRPIDQSIVTGVLVPSAQRPLLEVTLAVYVPAFVPTLPVMSIVALSKPVTVTVCAEPL